MKKIEKPQEEWFSEMGMDEVIVLCFGEVLKPVWREEEGDNTISLKDISDQFPEKTLLVIWERPLEGAVYRYNNYSDKTWYQVGVLDGYA